MNMKFIWSSALVGVGVLASACGSSSEGGGSDTENKTASSAWGCEAKGSDRVVCTSAMTLMEGKENNLDAYVCAPGDKSAKCPDEAAIKETGGTAIDAEKAAAYDDLPWACLTTGKHQVQCARDLVIQGKATEQTLSGSGGGSGCGSCGGGGKKPVPPPSTCSVSAWEDYFPSLAHEIYQGFGYNVDFPRNVFNVSAPLGELVSGGIINTPGKPSCYVAEWDLRLQAWLKAVARGCVNLTGPILVWCQQASNYAPHSQQCNATGSWSTGK
ncbi:hypothetical protein [Pendulispora albinea]|uniref:Uncharacterized protein n=1 Tax=Pendulispora albinea TaxID=2741071 RepID=A0ABZ2LXR7_9BACT